MSDDEFLTLREGLATRKAEKPKTLKDRGMLLWNEIFIQQYNFERQEIELKELAQVSKQDLINFFKVVAMWKWATTAQVLIWICIKPNVFDF